MRSHSFLAAFLSFLSAARFGVAVEVCALVPEGTPASLACPPGQLISSFSFATFGTFAPASSCADGPLFPYPECPTSVLAQAARLCVGSPNCALSCDCDSLPAPCGCVSSAPSLDGAPLRLLFPGVPCAGVAKQLGVVATCAPALPAPAPQPAPPSAAPTNPLLELLPPPVLGVDALMPHFSWTPPAAAARLPPAAVQSAARVVVTTSSGAPVWDSGAVPTTVPLLLPGAPLPLAADASYSWTVATADAGGEWSPPSAPARFTTGLFAPSDWGGAAWIGAWRPGTLLRKDFTVAAPAPSRVSAFVSGCQYYVLYIDGARVGSHELDVGWTRAPLFRTYATYDIDPLLLAPGQHTLGLALGQGFCGQSGGNAGNHTTQGLLRLALHGADGSLLQAVVTDTTWSAGSGPVISDSTYFGENYDATKEQPGWAAPGFVPPAGAPPWAPAMLANDPPTPPRMSSQLMPAIERVAVLAPLSITPVAFAAMPCQAGVGEGQTAFFTCPPAQAFSGVDFASFGTPSGACGALRKGTCDSANSTAVLTAACVGRSACSLAVSVATFGADPCLGTAKTFAASMTCAPSPNATPPVLRYTYDFGQQVSGHVRLSLPPTQRGTNVTLKHAEAMSHPPYAAFDGSAWMGNLFWAYPCVFRKPPRARARAHTGAMSCPPRARRPTPFLCAQFSHPTYPFHAIADTNSPCRVDSYITSGAAGGEVWEPSFTDHGFRYVEVSFDPPLAAPPGLGALSAVVLRTAARPQTTLLLGNPLLQALSNSSWWTESTALKGIPQGCGARGERCGWAGDAAFASESELNDFDTGAFFTQWAAQLQELQCSDGSVGSCMPNSDPHRDGFPAGPDTCKGVTGDPSWGTVYPTVVWGIWKYYGAVGVAARHYPSILSYYNMVEANVNASGVRFCLRCSAHTARLDAFLPPPPPHTHTLR
jgi:alpha-L-rhamnosidase